MANGRGVTWGLYARVSDPKQAAEGLSVDAQLVALREWAKSKGHEVREYVDRGKSAWVEDLNKRPEFLQMLEDVRGSSLDGIAVTHIDRFSRKLIVTLTVLGEFGKRGVGFVSLENAAFDFSRPADRLMLAVMGAFAQYYSDELSRKIRRGLGERASRGLHVGTLEFGYCNSRCVDCKNANPPCPRWGTIPRDAPAMLHPVDEPGVRLAFESYRKGNVSYDDVSNIVNDAGYRSRTSHGRVLWNKYSIAELLTNLSYTGVVVLKGKELAGKHPPIISRELFDEVQTIRRKRKSHQKTYNPKHRVYLFNGIITCAGCGRKMRAQAWGMNQTKSYRCTAKERKQTDCPKSQSRIPENVLESQFTDIVSQLKLPDDWRTRVVQLINGNDKQRNVENDRRNLTERLARIKQQYEWGDIGDQEYARKRDEIKGALSELEPPATAAIIDAARYLQNMCEVWENATKAECRDMIRAILDEVICDPNALRLVSLKPKPAFRLLFRQIHGLAERDGIFEITES